MYQQAQLNTKYGQISIVYRIRNEQRWQEKIANDIVTGETRFSKVAFISRIQEKKRNITYRFRRDFNPIWKGCCLKHF